MPEPDSPALKSFFKQYMDFDQQNVYLSNFKRASLRSANITFPWRNLFPGFSYPFVFLNDNKPSTAIFAGPQITLFLNFPDPANNIEIHLKTVSFSTVRTKFCGQGIPLFLIPSFYNRHLQII
jgi:hypothetical protein